MNKKGQGSYGEIGIIIATFIAIMVGVILFQAIAQEASYGLNTVTLANLSLGAATNLTPIYIDYRSVSSVVIINGTTGIVVAADNYTVTNNFIDPSDGTLSVRIVPSAGVGYNGAGSAWYISGTAQPTTYIADAGGRAITGLIAVFFALAVAIVALVPTLRSNILGVLGR